MKDKLYTLIVALLSVVFVVSGGFIARYFFNSAQRNRTQQQLIEMTQQPTEEKELTEYKNGEYFLPEYYDVYLQNSDLVGWIKIEDTKVNYPVVQNKQYKEYYLRRGFDKKYAFHGTPFMAENCSWETGNVSDNIIIYAHNMTDGSMFGDLEKLMNVYFWENHKTVQFDTLTRRGTYEILSVFRTVAPTEDTPAYSEIYNNLFEYYNFTDARDEEEFNNFVTKCKELAIYDTGVTAEYGDKLITLSTCEYSKDNGRLVLVAVKKK